jgi:hypothetical protein
VNGISKISSSATLVRNDEPVSVEVERSIVMMSLDLGKYFGLNEVGSRIWELLERPRSMADLCAVLQQEFEVDPNACHEEVSEFLLALAKEGLIQIDNDPPSPIRPTPEP